jgi:hypothetical protein
MAGFVLWLKNPYRSTDLLPKTPTTQARSNGVAKLRVLVAVAFSVRRIYRSAGEEATRHLPVLYNCGLA